MENCRSNRNLVVAPLSLLAYPTDTDTIPSQSSDRNLIAAVSPTMIPCHTMLAEIRWDEEAGLGGMLLAPKSATCLRRNVADSLDRLRPSGVRRSRIRFPSPSKRCFSLA